ncbi:MAG: hypothetical protein AAF194_04450 [Pseudomonadota bacterium]
MSLIFVGLELRHANNVAEADAVMQINAMYLETSVSAEHDPDLIRSLAEKFEIEEAVVRRGFRNVQTMNIIEAAWTSFDRGIMDEDHLNAYLTDGCVVLFPEGFSGSIVTHSGATPWNEYKRVLNPKFVNKFETFCRAL